MKILRKLKLFGIIFISSLVATGCISMKVNLTDYTDPLKEVTLEGKGNNKVAVIPINGHISDKEEEGMMRRKPSLVKEVVSQIRKAENDPGVKAIVLKINSSGGSVTASDMLYNEIKKLKEKTNIPVVVSMMDIATSGGYYVSLPADHIVAHQTTITGSVGVVFIRPKFQGLMDKIGVGVETSQSGVSKDMGSPFRPTTVGEEKSFQIIIDEMADIFESKVRQHRNLSDAAMEEVMMAKVYTAKQALAIGLIDEIGYTETAISKAKSMAGLEEDARVIMYRRVEFADDNIYNDISAHSATGSSLVNLGALSQLSDIKAGFYYTWPAVTTN
ncbi:signal peptide peptidase SppA [bacterium]|nr:signal peptide peptidase SppA [bacterium]